MPTSNYSFTNIQLEHIIIPTHWGNNSWPQKQQAAARDPTPQQADKLQPGKMCIYPSMLATKQIPVLDLTNTTITSTADLQSAFHTLNLSSQQTQWQRRYPSKRTLQLITYQIANH